MCGITGLVYLEKERQPNKQVLKKMADSICHRGPDDEGYFIDGQIGLGFRRLSIIDLHSGAQPISNQNETIHIIFNGEIYNYREERERLVKKGYIFKTNTDTEVILHLYEEYGVKCLQYLRGMFAFAIWDGNKQQLFCARDRFGIKPFYYYSDNNKFIFSSEIKSILSHGDVDKTISLDALDSYLTFGHIASDLSVYSKIKKLQPAHYLLLSLQKTNEIKVDSYWDVHFEPDFSKTEEQWQNEIEECLSESVKIHMVSEVPLGAFLSGGLDSSAVVAMMTKNPTRPIKTFSIGFKEEEFNELKYAREVAGIFGCEHHEQIVDPASVDLLPEIVKTYDEPFADSSAIPTFYLSKMTRQYVTVALSGDGGDELFAGYDRYQKFNSLKSFPLNFKNGRTNRLLWGNINKLIPPYAKGKGITYLMSKNRDLAYAFQAVWSVPERKKLMKQINLPGFTANEFYKEGILSNRKNEEFLSTLQYLDLKTYMVDEVLTKVDRASMANSLEVRVPLLDHKFAELTFKIPSGLKLKEGKKKYIFKETLKKYLPDNIINRPKQGFGSPFSAWFKNDLKQFVDDTFFLQKPLVADFVDIDYIKKIITISRKGRHGFRDKIWSLIVLEEWLRQNR